MAPKLSTQIFCLFERERERERERGGQYITIYSVYLHLERGKRKEWGERNDREREEKTFRLNRVAGNEFLI